MLSIIKTDYVRISIIPLIFSKSITGKRSGVVVLDKSFFKEKKLISDVNKFKKTK